MSVKDFLIKWKVRFGAAASIFGMVGVPYLVAVQAQRQLGEFGVVVPFFLIMFIGIVALLVVGYLYDELGYFSSENGYCLQKNNEWSKRHEK